MNRMNESKTEKKKKKKDATQTLGACSLSDIGWLLNSRNCCFKQSVPRHDHMWQVYVNKCG